MTAEQYARRMAKRPELVEREFKKSVHGLAVSALKFSKEKLSELYQIPEDLTAKGKKKWRRTGHLRRSERIEERSAYEYALVNDAVYAEPRHEAGKPNRRSINLLRVNHWRDETFKVMEPINRDVFRQTLLDLLRGGTI